MKSPSLTDLLRPFLETRAPLLFLIGSLALAILGNAVYELLTSTFGATPEFLIALVIGTTLVLLFATLSLLRILRLFERRQIRARNRVAPEQQAPPHAGLILPVGLSKQGAEEAIIAWHQPGKVLRHCWLLVSPEVAEHPKFGNLKQQLWEQNVTPHVVTLADSIQIAQVYAEVRAAIEEARKLRDATPLIADLTAGTKVMTAGTLLACLNEAVAMHYWSTPRDHDGKPRLVEEGRPMRVMVQTAIEEVPDL